MNSGHHRQSDSLEQHPDSGGRPRSRGLRGFLFEQRFLMQKLMDSSSPKDLKANKFFTKRKHFDNAKFQRARTNSCRINLSRIPLRRLTRKQAQQRPTPRTVCSNTGVSKRFVYPTSCPNGIVPPKQLGPSEPKTTFVTPTNEGG